MTYPDYEFYCTLQKSRRVWPCGPHNLNIIAERCGCNLKNHHHALADADACAVIALTARSLSHKGCIAYDVFESATRPDIFMICETWENQEVLDLHSATPEFAEYVGIIEDCGQLKLEKFEF